MMSRQLEIIEGAELIEIWTKDASDPLLLATHRIGYSDTLTRTHKGLHLLTFLFRFNTAGIVYYKLQAMIVRRKVYEKPLSR